MVTGSLEGIEAELVASMGQLEAQLDEDRPFRVALLGDWSGRANRSVFASSVELADWRPLLVDRDNLDERIKKLGVKLQLPPLEQQGSPLIIDFSELADFHPDRLFERLEIFESLRRTRAQLSNPKTFAAAAAEVRSWAGFQPDRDAASPKVDDKNPDEQKPPLTKSRETLPAGDLLDQILENKSSEIPAAESAPQLSPRSPNWRGLRSNLFFHQISKKTRMK